MRIAFPAALLGALVTSACGGSDERTAMKNDPSTLHVQTAVSAASQTLKEGDVRIVSVDNGIDLALIGDTISSGLSRSALAKVAEETDTNKVGGAGFSASLEKMVKSTVQNSISTRMAFPVSELSDAEVTNGRIVFMKGGKPYEVFTGTKVSGKPLLESFPPDDAQRFVQAVKARITSRVAH